MSFERRAFLKLATAGCAFCLSGFAIAGDPANGHAPKTEAGHAKRHWSYEGDTGPNHWGELSPEFRVCDLGLEQTPIDLTAGLTGETGALAFEYKAVPLKILNNGHTIQVNVEPGSAVVINGVRYELLQFHFHHPSEHLLDGKAFEMEIHFVHKSAEGKLAVVGVFFKPGAHNAVLEPIFARMPKAEAAAASISGEFDPKAFLPASDRHFRYMGSLTTPPCSEGLTWTVFRDPVEVSPEQIRQFASLFPNNARPVQRKNRRFVIEAGS